MLALGSGGGVQAIGIPYSSCSRRRPFASRSGTNSGLTVSDSTTMCVLQSSCSP